MASTQQPLLVVLGATGNQGGSVLSYFLSMSPSPYRLRGVTRNISSNKAAALSSVGVEMVAADFDEPSTLDAAFKGAAVIFSVTDYWAQFFDPSQREKAAASGQTIGPFTRDYEAQQCKNIIDAAAKVDTLDRFIYSTLPNTSRISGGKYAHVYHADGKALGEDYGVSTHPKFWEKATIFYAGFYLENFLGPSGAPFRPKLNKAQDTLTLYAAEPVISAALPMYSTVEDTGTLMHALLQAAPVKKLIGATEWVDLKDFTNTLAEVLEKKTNYVDQIPSFPIEDPDFIQDQMEFIGFCIEFGFDGGRVDKSVVKPTGLGVPVKLMSLKEWCKKQDWKAMLEVEEI